MDLDFKQLGVAIRAIAEEKNLPEDSVQEVVEQALAAAYRRDYGEREQEVRVKMNLNTGEVGEVLKRVFRAETTQTQVCGLNSLLPYAGA